MKLKIPIFLFFILLVSCGDPTINLDIKPTSNTKLEPVVPSFDGIGLNTQKFSDQEKSFIPRTYPSIYDSIYMNEVNILLRTNAGVFSSGVFFQNLIKAIAWKETNWTHYYLDTDQNVFLIKGDNDQSFGMFQIYTRYHPALPEIIENTEYATDLAWTIYQEVKNKECSSGSNKGNTEVEILRRIYATYNGGSGNTCRDADSRDTLFVDHFYEHPWENYL